MTGTTISRNVDNNSLGLCGGKGYGCGALLQLTGKEEIGEGQFNIQAHNGTVGKILKGKPTGELTWDGKEIITEGNLAIKTSRIYSENLNNAYKNLSNYRFFPDSENAPVADYGVAFALNSDGDVISASFTGWIFQLAFRTNDDEMYLRRHINDEDWTEWKEVNVIDSQGDGYIRYSSGLQMCWGSFQGITTAQKTISFPKSFSSSPSISVNGQSGIYVTVASWNNSAFDVVSATSSDTNAWFMWQAIGRWK